MINIWRLTRIQLLSSFGLNKALHAEDPKEKRKWLLLSFGMLLSMVIIAGASFGYSYGMAMAFEQAGRMDLLLAVMMAVTSVVSFFTTIYKAGDVLFGFKDYDLVMSLPIRTSHVVASRVLQLYVLNLFFSLIVMVPAGAVYAIKINPGALYYVYFLITLVMIPFVPIIGATIIGALISWISSRFKGSRIISLVLTFAVIIAMMLGSFSMNGNEQLLTELASNLADLIFKLYPLAVMYIDAVCSYRLDSLLLFIVISVLAFTLFTYTLGTRFKSIHTGLTTSYASSKYQMKELRTSSPFRALYKKELRRFVSSSSYVLNSSFGMVLLLVMSVSLLFVSPEAFGQMLEIPRLSDYLSRLAPLAVSLFIIMSCTTSSSISLEGNHLWILKSSPVSKQAILFSKVAVNLTVTLPMMLISGVLLIISLGTGWAESILLLVIPGLYACYSALVGVLVNLKLPNFTWTNEVTVIKQSAAVIVSLLIGFISLAVPFGLSVFVPGIHTYIILLAITIIMGVASGLLYRYLKRHGDRLFQALE